MKYRIKRAFPYAHNGIHVQDLAVDEEHEIVVDAVAGLKAEGYIEDIDPAKAPKPEPAPKGAKAAKGADAAAEA